MRRGVALGIGLWLAHSGVASAQGGLVSSPVTTTGKVVAEVPARGLLPTVIRPGAYKSAKSRRDLGIGLAVPGVALSVLGGVLIGFGTQDPNLFSELNEIIGGVITGVGGLVIGIPGVYFWSTGQDRMDAAVWRSRQLNAPAR